MKIIPLQTPETVTTNDPAVLGRLNYVVELNGAELYAFRALARNISGPIDSTVRGVTDELAETDIPGLPGPFEADPDRRWYSGTLTPQRLNSFRAKPVEPAPGFNPRGLTAGDVGEGWRLLSQAEVRACTGTDPYTDPQGFEFPGFPETQYLISTEPAHWSKTGRWHAYGKDEGECGTLRTNKPEGYYLTRRSGVHNPAKVKPEQVGDGWRLLTVDEAKSKVDHADSQFWTSDKTWSRTGTWRAYDRPTGTLRVRE